MLSRPCNWSNEHLKTTPDDNVWWVHHRIPAVS
jgi:hypothetical protein